MSREPQVIVVGGGPGGSSAALRLAQAGVTVRLFDKSDFPREKSCGDGLTRMSAKLLHRSGILDRLVNSPEIHGVKIFMKGKGTREFEYPDDIAEPRYGMVVPRFQLDNVLLKKAIEAGADFQRATVTTLVQDNRGKVIGVLIDSPAGAQRIEADLVIIADGAASRLAYQLELPTTPRNRLGFGIRAYYSGIQDLSELLEIYLPLLDNTQRYVLPSYGWVFPLSEGTANIGIGLIEKRRDDDVSRILSRFTSMLGETDPRFAGMKLMGKPVGAPMRFDFHAERSFAPGAMLVGDAAGLISPFTGEGIAYAIESGTLAAETCIRMRQTPGQTWMDLSPYGHALGRKFQGYFAAGHESGKRYLLTYNVVRDTFDNERPLFHLLRQATMFPEGVGESFVDRLTKDVTADIQANRAELRADMLSIGNGLLQIMRKDWPFLAKAFSPEGITPGLPFRPSLFLLLSGYLFQPDRALLIQLGIAVELGILAGICHNSVDTEKEKKEIEYVSNRGNVFSVLVGDFLLSKSFESIARLSPGYLGALSRFLSRSSEGLLLEKQSAFSSDLPVPKYLEMLYEKYAGLFEACMFLGACAGKAGIKEANECGRFGKHFGAAYHIMEDALSSEDHAGSVSMVARSDLTLGQFNLAQLLQLHCQEEPRRTELLKEIAQGVTQSFPIDPAHRTSAGLIALQELDKAEECLNGFPDSGSKSSIQAICGRIRLQASRQPDGLVAPCAPG